MSRGFLKIRSSSEINQFLFEKTKAFSKSGHVIVQSFVEGDMLTLDGICSGGKHRTIAVSKKDGYFTPGINTGFRYPYNSPLMEQIIKENDRYIERSGMRYGLTHSEYIIDRDKFCLMEIGGRGGGAGITNKIVPWVTGIDVYELFYRSMRGEALELDKLDVLQRSALLRYYTKEQLELSLIHI